MTTPAEFRKRAEDCVQLAQNARPQDRTILLGIAQAWVELADQATADAELLATPIDRRLIDGAAKPIP
jgi:hypothetical protein